MRRRRGWQESRRRSGGCKLIWWHVGYRAIEPGRSTGAVLPGFRIEWGRDYFDGCGAHCVVRQWRVLVLLVISALINYMTAPRSRSEPPIFSGNWGCRITISASCTRHSWRVCAFQLFFAGGLAVDPLTWAGCWGWVFHLVGSHGFHRRGWLAVILGLRMLLGMGNRSPTRRIHAPGEPISGHHRGFANAMIDAGTKVGGHRHAGRRAAGKPVGMWRSFWCWAWAACCGCFPGIRECPRAREFRRISRTDIASIGDILRQRSAWFSAFGLFCRSTSGIFSHWLPAHGEPALPESRWRCWGRFRFWRSRSCDGRLALRPADCARPYADACAEMSRESG